MLKNLLILICIFCIVINFTGCTDNIKNKETTLVSNPINNKKNNGSLDNPEVTSYFKLTKDVIIKKLGSGYKIVATGAEGSFEGYNYSNRGITFVFENDGSLTFINCNEKFEFRGIKPGMNFKQIQEKLGKAKIEETWYESPENKAFKISYEIDNCVFNFMSFQRDGTDSNLTIHKSN